jgi:23S rRNA (adenine2503-C2)-methyltransferase
VPSRYDLDRDGLARLLDGEPRYRVDQVWDGLYRQGRDPEEITNLPAPLRARLTAELPLALEEARRQEGDGGRTVKWAWSVEGGHRVETVLMHYDRRSTACISTQAGCAMGCGFCATGQAGFARHLGVGEIVEQVVRARREAGGRRVSNVVFMGMGEPLANYDQTWAAVERIHGALGIGARSLTVSTVGVVPGIRRLAGEDLPVGLAVSLHAADDDLRDELVPLNRRYPLAELEAACEEWRRSRGRRLSLEWAMIAGVNDRPADADRLAAIARRQRAHVNLIPLNPTPGYPTVGSSPTVVDDFRAHLAAAGVAVTVRANRGVDIDAACGQLAGRVTPVAAPLKVRQRTRTVAREP